MAEEILLAFSTFPDIETARRIAGQLVTEDFAACANIIPAIESIYRWEGKIESGTETLVLFKTAAARYPAFQDRLKSLHPYDVPEIIACPVDKALPEYLRWVIDSSARET
jgi:periplasmic divalent cation tolerance protein